MADPDPRYEIDDPEIKALLKRMAETLQRQLPGGWGLTLMLFEYKGPSFFYMSTADRDDMIRNLKEFIQREQRQ
jgi:hypothetical protein